MQRPPLENNSKIIIPYSCLGNKVYGILQLGNILKGGENMETNYRTFQIHIKQGHRLYSYFLRHAEGSKCLYNATNFYYRQVMTAMKTTKPLQPLQEQALKEIVQALGAMNENQKKAYEKRLSKEQSKPIEEQKDVKITLFEEPSASRPYLTYGFLDAFFKQTNQTDYRALPTHTAQATIKLVFQDWKSFFEAKKEYKLHPEKFTGEPKIPRYKKQGVLKEVIYSNQESTISACGKYLKLPQTKVKLNIGKLGLKGELKQVRVIPKHGVFFVELVLEPNDQTIVSKPLTDTLMSIDLGVDNLATLVLNNGTSPILIKGKHIKSINQCYNKMKGHFYGILRQGMSPKEGLFTSVRLEKMHQKRHLKIKDLFHKASYHIVQIALQNNVSKVIIGKNTSWKQETNIGKKNNQSFCSIPHDMLIKQLQYKLQAVGIELVVREESYTSKASFLDLDDIPNYDPTNSAKHKFSGYRVTRGLYKSKTQQRIINADVNGACNIMRKEVPNAFANGIEGLPNQFDAFKLKGIVSTPLVLSVR